MLTETKRFICELEEVKVLLTTKIAAEAFEDMDADELMLSSKMFRLLNNAENLLVAQAELMESMDKKLDTLLSKREL